MKEQLKNAIDFFANSKSDKIVLSVLFDKMIEYCAAHDCDDALKILMDGSQSVRQFDALNHDQDILKLAVEFSSINVVKTILSKFSGDAKTDNSQLLCQAVADDKYEIAELLIEYGADVSTDKNDPLRLACGTRNYRMAKMLIKNGAIVDESLLETIKNMNDLELFNISVSEDRAKLNAAARWSC